MNVNIVKPESPDMLVESIIPQTVFKYGTCHYLMTDKGSMDITKTNHTTRKTLYVDVVVVHLASGTLCFMHKGTKIPVNDIIGKMEVTE